MHPIEFVAEADEEISQVIDWYAERDPAVAEKFVNDLGQAIERVRVHPNRWSKHIHGTRHIRLKEFPYYVVYRVVRDSVVIIAVPHVSRRQGYWKNRKQN